ncbi:hypothetical protein BJ165DRAFT_1460735 [Panaeolus papilionaceus]|nr:hypothetical protein BJ165DRAFT_1460735 [Panaeolus papilionaceus]
MSSLHNTDRHPSLSFQSQSQTPSSTHPPSYKSTPATSLFSDSRNSSSTGGLQEFFYELSNAGKPYLKVTLLANGVLAKHQPTIVQGMRLSGNVQFHLGNGDDVLSLTGIVQGKLLYGSHEGGGKSLVFLRIVKEFYSRQSGSPKPSGDFSWSFDIELPKDVTIPVPETPGETRTFSMPQTTQERQSRASTVYGLTFQIVRGKFKTNKECVFLRTVL